MNTRIRAFLWDMDGTIIDTAESHYTSWRMVLKKFGVDLDRNEFLKKFGQNNQACTSEYLGYEPTPTLMEEISEEKEALFRKIALKESKLVNGVETWLGYLKKEGFSQALATSAPMPNIVDLLNKFNLQSYFSKIVSGYELPAKPAPDVFLKAAMLVGLSPESCCVIEDSIVGVQAAKNAGMTCIAVTTTQTSSTLKLADIMIKDFTKPISEVLRLLP